MKKIFKQFFFFVILFLLILLFKENKLFSLSNKIKPYDSLIVSISKENIDVSMKAFNEFDEIFSDVYVDSTEFYNLQTILKTVNSYDLDMQLLLLDSHDFSALFNLLSIYLKENEFNINISFLNILNNFLTSFKSYLKHNELNSTIGYELQYSLLIDYEPLSALNKKNIFNKTKLNLKVKHETDINSLYLVLSNFDDRISKIESILVSNVDVYNQLININSNNDNDLKFVLKEYFIAHSSTLDDLSYTVDLINESSNKIEVESILRYLNEDALVKGDRYKKIRDFSLKNKKKIKKIYLDVEQLEMYLEDFLYYLNIEDDELSVNYRLNYLKNLISVNIAELVPLLGNNSSVSYYYMQDAYFEAHQECMVYFCNLEPITFEYLNSSVKKDFYNFENNSFISKIYMENHSIKQKKYIDELFKRKKTILK